MSILIDMMNRPCNRAPMHSGSRLVLQALIVVAVACSDFTDPSQALASYSSGWRSAALGTYHTCAISSPDGITYCFGSAAGGILGDAHAHDSSCVANGFHTPCRVAPMHVSNDPSFVTLAASNGNTCGLTNDGAAYCWGIGAGGILGTVHDSSVVPLKLHSFAPLRSITVGQSFACGLTTLDSTVCWGDGKYGQLGAAMVSSDTPRVVTPSLHFITVSAGASHVCGLIADGTAYCWGSNGSGQLGIGITDTVAHAAPVIVSSVVKFTDIQAGGARTCALAVDRSVWCWGNVYFGNPTPPQGMPNPTMLPGGLAFRSISVGTATSCGITTSGAAYCWTDTSAPAIVPGLHVFQSIVVGDYHACGITDANDMWCWGWGNDGQLGKVGLPDLCFASDDSYPCALTPVLVKR